MATINTMISATKNKPNKFNAKAAINITPPRRAAKILGALSICGDVNFNTDDSLFAEMFIILNFE